MGCVRKTPYMRMPCVMDHKGNEKAGSGGQDPGTGAGTVHGKIAGIKGGNAFHGTEKESCAAMWALLRNAGDFV